MCGLCGKSLSRVQLCDPMDCSLSGYSVHGIFLARVLEWISISFSRGSSQPRNWTRVSHISGRCFTVWATREAFIFYINTDYYTQLLSQVSSLSYSNLLYSHGFLLIYLSRNERGVFLFSITVVIFLLDATSYRFCL